MSSKKYIISSYPPNVRKILHVTADSLHCDKISLVKLGVYVPQALDDLS